jgi:hypothetical protein
MSAENNSIERGRIPFPWQELEKHDAEFRALIASCIDLGANATDIATLLTNIPETRHLAKPSVEAIEQYLTHRTRRSDKDTFRTQLLSQGVPNELQHKVYEDVYKYMRIRHPQRLWRNARNLRAIALYLLEKRKLPSYRITQILARQFDIKIDATSGVNMALSDYRVSIRRLHPDIPETELLAETRKRLANELRSGLTEAELERGELEGRQAEELQLAAKKAEFNNWRQDWKSQVFVAEIFRKVKSKKKATLFAIHALEDTFDIHADAHSLRSFFRRTVAERARAIEECEKDIAPKDVNAIREQVANVVQEYERRFESLLPLSGPDTVREKIITDEPKRRSIPANKLQPGYTYEETVSVFGTLERKLMRLRESLEGDQMRPPRLRRLPFIKSSEYLGTVNQLEKTIRDIGTSLLQAHGMPAPEIMDLIADRIAAIIEVLPDDLRPRASEK